MYVLEHRIECKSRGDRIEIFPFQDLHVGKFNLNEEALKKQIAEVKRRSEMPDRHVRVIFLGDQLNAIKPSDVRRFDFDEMADWFFTPPKAGQETHAQYIKRMLSDICKQEAEHFIELFEPIKHLCVGALYGNHEGALRTRNNTNLHEVVCQRLGMTNLTREALIRFKFIRSGKSRKLRDNRSTSIVLYIRHGYGGGRTVSAEMRKAEAMVDEWECADVCLTAHTHTYCPPHTKPSPRIKMSRSLSESDFYYANRHAANAGCWLESHKVGPSTYESDMCYPAKAMMTLKVVVWPFWRMSNKGKKIEIPKVELRSYPIL